MASPRRRRSPIDARRRRAMCGNPTRRRRRSRPRRPGTEAPKRAPSTFFWRAPFKNLSGRPTSSASLRRVSLPSLSVRGDRGSTNSVGQLSLLRYAPTGTPARRQRARRAAKSSSSEKKPNPPGTRAATPRLVHHARHGHARPAPPDGRLPRRGPPGAPHLGFRPRERGPGPAEGRRAPKSYGGRDSSRPRRAPRGRHPTRLADERRRLFRFGLVG